MSNTSTVARQPDGSLVVVWEGKGTGDDYGVFLRRFDAVGQATTPEIRVNTYTTGTQGQPAIAPGKQPFKNTGFRLLPFEMNAPDS